MLYCIFTRVMSNIYYIAFYVFLVFLWMGPRPMFLGPIFQPILQPIFRFFCRPLHSPIKAQAGHGARPTMLIFQAQRGSLLSQRSPPSEDSSPRAISADLFPQAWRAAVWRLFLLAFGQLSLPRTQLFYNEQHASSSVNLAAFLPSPCKDCRCPLHHHCLPPCTGMLHRLCPNTPRPHCLSTAPSSCHWVYATISLSCSHQIIDDLMFLRKIHVQVKAIHSIKSNKNLWNISSFEKISHLLRLYNCNFDNLFVKQ